MKVYLWEELMVRAQPLWDFITWRIFVMRLWTTMGFLVFLILGCGSAEERNNLETSSPNAVPPIVNQPVTLSTVLQGLKPVPGVTHGPLLGENAPGMSGFKKAKEVNGFRLVKRGKVDGTLSVHLYDSQDLADKDYKREVAGMAGEKPLPDVGDRAMISGKDEFRVIGSTKHDLSYASVTFQRGKAVVHFIMGWQGATRNAAQFAKQVDDAISKLPAIQ